MSSKLAKAVDRYIADHCKSLDESPKCNVCKVEQELYDDSLSGQVFCRACLTDDLKTDTDFAVNYLGETNESQGRV
jgi:hypothetical protein